MAPVAEIIGINSVLIIGSFASWEILKGVGYTGLVSNHNRKIEEIRINTANTNARKRGINKKYIGLISLFGI
ncbi:MAG: hypothetical protein ABSD69_00305 [Candidatus Levyibacteriota bacterium]